MARDTGKLRLTAVAWFPSDDQARVSFEFNTRKNGPAATRQLVTMVLAENISPDEVARMLEAAAGHVRNLLLRQDPPKHNKCKHCGGPLRAPSAECGGCI